MNTFKTEKSRKTLKTLAYILAFALACTCAILYIILMCHFRNVPNSTIPEWWNIIWQPW